MSTGQFDFAEIPAGMLDGSRNFVGVAAKELEEEVGIKVQDKDLVDLSALAKHPRGFFASPGGSDETIRLFSLTQEVAREKLSELNGRLTGVLEEGELITLKVVLWMISSTSQMAKPLYLFTLQAISRKGLINLDSPLRQKLRSSLFKPSQNFFIVPAFYVLSFLKFQFFIYLVHRFQKLHHLLSSLQIIVLRRE